MRKTIAWFCAVKRLLQECEVIVAAEQFREDGWGKERKGGEEKRYICEQAAKPCKPHNIGLFSLTVKK